MFNGSAFLARTWAAMPAPLQEALKACRRHFTFVILFSAGLNLLYLAPTLYMMQVYDRVLSTGGVLTLVFLTIALAASLAVLAFLDAVRMRLLAAAGRRIDRLVAPNVLRAALDRKGREAAGAANPMREFDTLRTALTGAPTLAVIDAPWAPLYILVCFMIHPMIGVLALVGGVLMIGLAYINQRAMHNALRANEQLGGAFYSLQTGDSAQGEVARSLGMEQALVRRQMKVREAVALRTDRSSRTNAGYSAATKFTRLILQSLALGLGAYLALSQQISAGSIIASSVLTARAFAPLELIVGAWRQFEQGRHAYDVVVRVLRSQDATRTYTELPPPRAMLAVQGVGVRVPGSDSTLLQGVSFVVEPGEIVGVIGPSGAGKTTLMRAVAGAVAPDAGILRLDGASMADWPPGGLGRYIGYMPQEGGLFAGTVAGNIARFESGPDVDKAIIAAAMAAGAHEMILSLPRGYDTELSVGGRGLSAGQIQRIGLARALFRDPVLLVLDEPNAHLDVEGEQALIEALLHHARAQRSALVVAHRARFLSIADKLLVMKAGRVEMFGPREQILAKLPGLQSQPALTRETGVRRS